MTSKPNPNADDLGVAGLMKAHIKKRQRAELEQDAFNVYVLAGEEQQAHRETKAALKVRNSAGARARAIKYAPARAKATAIYAQMETALGKKPPFESFLEELISHYPKEPWPIQKKKGIPPKVVEPWDRDTTNDWWKKLNKGEAI